MKGKLIGLALVLIVIGTIGSLVTARDYFNYEQVSGGEKIKADSLEKIHVQTKVSQLEIRPSQDEYIHVNWSRKASLMKEAKLHTIIKDRSFKIYEKEENTFQFLNFSFPWQESKLEILVPENEIINLFVSNSVGEVFLDSLSVEHIKIETDLANILLHNLKTKEMDLSTSVGKIAISNSSGRILAKSDVGDIQISSLKIKNDISVETEIGNIKVETKEDDLEASIYSSSELGDIKIFNRKTEDYILDRAKYIIRLKTDIGNIKVSETR